MEQTASPGGQAPTFSQPQLSSPLPSCACAVDQSGDLGASALHMSIGKLPHGFGQFVKQLTRYKHLVSHRASTNSADGRVARLSLPAAKPPPWHVVKDASQ